MPAPLPSRQRQVQVGVAGAAVLQEGAGLPGLLVAVYARGCGGWGWGWRRAKVGGVRKGEGALRAARTQPGPQPALLPASHARPARPLSTRHPPASVRAAAQTHSAPKSWSRTSSAWRCEAKGWPGAACMQQGPQSWHACGRPRSVGCCASAARCALASASTCSSTCARWGGMGEAWGGCRSAAGHQSVGGVQDNAQQPSGRRAISSTTATPLQQPGPCSSHLPAGSPQCRPPLGRRSERDTGGMH